MIVYIAGKMTGLPDKGRGLFHAAADWLRGKGFTALDPAILPDGLPGCAYMPICLSMLDQADAILLLPGWEDSPGARLEKAYAEYQNKEIWYLRGKTAESDADGAERTLRGRQGEGACGAPGSSRPTTWDEGTGTAETRGKGA